MSDAVPQTTPPSLRTSVGRSWVTPRLAELPKLTALTLASAIGGTGGTGSGGSTVFGLLLALGLALGAGACSADRDLPGEPGPTIPPVSSQMISCTVRKVEAELTCLAPSAAPGVITLGGQGVSVALRSSNVSYSGGTDILSATVTLQNLSQVAIGTIDGSTVGTGIDVFFLSSPTGSLGEIIGLPNKDGTGFYTAVGQPFFRYLQLLTPQAISTGKSWQFFMNGASAFTFTVLVSAQTPSAGALLNWNIEPTMGYSRWHGIVGWGTSGLALMGDQGVRGVTENGVWVTRADQPGDGYAISIASSTEAAGGGGNNLYAVLDGGSNIRYWDGISWRSINALAGGPGGHTGGIVSNGTTLYSFTDSVRRFVPGSAAGGGTWNTLPSPMAPPNRCLAADFVKNRLVCYYENQSVWSWNGTQWISRGSTGISDATLLVASDTNNIWVYKRSFSGQLRHYAAGTWTNATGLPGTLDSWLIWGGDATAGGEYYFTAEGGPSGHAQIWHWTGSAWVVEFDHATRTPSVIYVRDADTVYAAGDRNLLLKRTGGTWGYVTGNVGPSTTAIWQGVAVTNKHDVMLGLGAGKTYHWDGTAWTLFTMPSVSNVAAFWKRPGTDLYVAGGTSVDRWTGSGWVTGPGGGGLSGVVANGLTGTGPNDLWAVGSSQFAGESNITHWDGVSWTKIANPQETGEFLGAWAYADTMAVAVGKLGIIDRWDGTAWTSMSSGTAQDLFAVWGLSPTEIWAVGNNGTIRHWDGATWGSGGSSCDGSNKIAGIWGKSATEIYLVTAGGRICFYNGTSWSTVPPTPGTLGELRAIAADPSGSLVYAVGMQVYRGTR